MTAPAVHVHCVCVCVRTWACESGDRCVTGDGGPCSHSSPVERQRRSAIHPHLARQSQPTGMCEVQTHTHTHTHTRGRHPH